MWHCCEQQSTNHGTDIKSLCHSWLIKGGNVSSNTLMIKILFRLHVTWLISLMFWWTLITLQSRLILRPLDTLATCRKRSNKTVFIDLKFIPANMASFFPFFYVVVLSPSICSSHPSRISSLSYNVSLYFWNCVLDFSSAFYGFLYMIWFYWKERCQGGFLLHCWPLGLCGSVVWMSVCVRIKAEKDFCISKNYPKFDGEKKILPINSIFIHRVIFFA